MALNCLRWSPMRIAAAVIAVGAAAAPAAAQTLQLTESNSTTIRGGSAANTNLSSDPVLATRASSDPEYARRIILKFDTQNTIPANTPITSAILTLTIAGGNSETRTISAYRISTSYEKREATWNRRYAATAWSRAGGDLAERFATASVTNVVGRTVSFDVRALVQATVNGTYGSRYTRIELIDAGAASRGSYREFYGQSSASRPVLTVTYGTTTTTAPAPAPAPTTPTPTTSATLKVLHWNVHHGGVGTDGRLDPNRIAYWVAQMNPDVISFNEVDNTTLVTGLVNAINARTGITWKTSFSGWGNLLMTRLALNNQSVCDINLVDGRKGAHLSTMVNGRIVNLWSVHLDVSSQADRISEVRATQSCEQSWPEVRIVAGDFNAQASSTEIGLMTQGHVDAWPAAKALGTATNYSGNCDGCTRNSRIDYQFVSRGASYASVRAARIYDTRDASGVMPSDHKPLLVTYTIR